MTKFCIFLHICYNFLHKIRNFAKVNGELNELNEYIYEFGN